MNEDEYSYEDAEQDQTASGAGDIFANVAQGLTGAHKAQLVAYWQQAIDGIERIGEPGSSDGHFKSTALPLARIKKVMKTDSEVRMISAEAPIVFAKGCDIFITELTMRAWIHAEESKRRTLQRSDIAMALQKSDMFDFLIDIVPREEAMPRRFHTQPQQPPQQAQQQSQQPQHPQQSQHAQPDQLLHHQQGGEQQQHIQHLQHDDDMSGDLSHSLQTQHQQIPPRFHSGPDPSHGVINGLSHMATHLRDEDNSPLDQHLINPGVVDVAHQKSGSGSPSVGLNVTNTLADTILGSQNSAHPGSEAGPILDGSVGSHHDNLVQSVSPSQQPDSLHGSPIVDSHDQEFAEETFDYTRGYEDDV